MDLIKNFDFAEFDHDKILENVTPILLPERNVTSDQVSCKVPGWKMSGCCSPSVRTKSCIY